MQSTTDNAILMYTTSWCPACWRAKQVLNSMNVAYREIDIGEDEAAAAQVIRINNGYRSVPTLIFPDGSVLTEPRTTELVQKLQATDQSSPGAAISGR